MTTIEESARARLERAVAAAVRQLRATADQIEREAARNIENAVNRTHDFSTYGHVAGQVAHTIAWNTANANISNVIDAATDADAARISGR